MIEFSDTGRESQYSDQSSRFDEERPKIMNSEEGRMERKTKGKRKKINKSSPKYTPTSKNNHTKGNGSILAKNSSATGAFEENFDLDKEDSVDASSAKQAASGKSTEEQNLRKHLIKEETVADRIISPGISQMEDIDGLAVKPLSSENLKQRKASDIMSQPRKKRKISKTAPISDQIGIGLITSDIPPSPSISGPVPPSHAEILGREDSPLATDVLQSTQSPNLSRNSGHGAAKSRLTSEKNSSGFANSSSGSSVLLRNEDPTLQPKDQNNVDSDAESESDNQTALQSGLGSESAKRVQPKPSDEVTNSDGSTPAQSLTKKVKATRKRALSESSPTQITHKITSLRKTPLPNFGRLSNDEIEKITNSVISFREQKGLTQHELNELVQKDANKSDESRELWIFLHDNIPTIPKQKLINICRRKFHNFEARGSWTIDQDAELSELIERYPGKWKKIGEILNRFPQDCRDRWRNYLVCGEKMRKDIWEVEEEKRLRHAVNEFLENYHRKHGDIDVDDDQLIDWQTISKMMGHTRSRLQCSMKWRTIKNRYESDDECSSATEPLSKTPWRLQEAKGIVRGLSSKEKLKLLYAVQEYDVKQESKIPWFIIQKHNAGVFGNKLALRVLFKNLKEQVPGHEQMKLADIVQHLIDTIKSSSRKRPEAISKSSPRISKKASAVTKRTKKSVTMPTAPTKGTPEISQSHPAQSMPLKENDGMEEIGLDNACSDTFASRINSNYQDDTQLPEEIDSDDTGHCDNSMLDEGISQTSKVMKGRIKNRTKYGVTSKTPVEKAKRSRQSNKRSAPISEAKVIDDGDDS